MLDADAKAKLNSLPHLSGGRRTLDTRELHGHIGKYGYEVLTAADGLDGLHALAKSLLINHFRSEYAADGRI